MHTHMTVFTHINIPKYVGILLVMPRKHTNILAIQYKSLKCWDGCGAADVVWHGSLEQN